MYVLVEKLIRSKNRAFLGVFATLEDARAALRKYEDTKGEKDRGRCCVFSADSVEGRVYVDPEIVKLREGIYTLENRIMLKKFLGKVFGLRFAGAVKDKKGRIRDNERDEIIDTALLKAWQRVHTCKNPKEVKRWLKKIAENTAKDYFRAKNVGGEEETPAMAEQRVRVHGWKTTGRRRFVSIRGYEPLYDVFGDNWKSEHSNLDDDHPAGIAGRSATAPQEKAADVILFEGQRLRRAVSRSKLTTQDMELLYRYEVLGQTLHEIAADLSVSHETVRRGIAAAKKRAAPASSEVLRRVG